MKVLTFLYGIISYVIFLGSFSYAAGFIGNMVVPKTIDTGEEIGLFSALLINALLLTVFAVQHSLMARPAFKQRWTKIVGKSAERSTYVLFSSLALILLYYFWQPVQTVVWEVETEMIRNIMIGLYFLGLLIVLLSTFMINHFDLFGLKQVYENLIGKKSEEPRFTTNYLYQLVRHPIMLGFLIVVWAAPTMTIGHLFFTIMVTLYIYIAVRFLEERDLKKLHGETYKEYQRNVPMLIPFTKFGRKKTLAREDV